MVGPPLGGAAIGLFGPVTTMAADAVSYLLSAAGIFAIGGRESRPVRGRRRPRPRARGRDLSEGWRYILTHPALRPVFFNQIAVGGLIMAVEPLISVLMLGRLGFAPWQYGLAFAAPCVGGIIGSRLSRRLVARYGRHTVMRTAGTLRACWPIGLAFVRPGAAGLLLVMAVQLGLLTCMGVFNPVYAAYRLDQTPGPGRPHPVRMVGEQQRHHRGADRPVGPAGQRHQPAHGDRGRRCSPAGHPAAAAPPGPDARASPGTGPQPGLTRTRRG